MWFVVNWLGPSPLLEGASHFTSFSLLSGAWQGAESAEILCGLRLAFTAEGRVVGLRWRWWRMTLTVTWARRRQKTNHFSIWRWWGFIRWFWYHANVDMVRFSTLFILPPNHHLSRTHLRKLFIIFKTPRHTILNINPIFKISKLQIFILIIFGSWDRFLEWAGRWHGKIISKCGEFKRIVLVLLGWEICCLVLLAYVAT